MDTYKAAPDIEVITTNIAIPGFGVVPVNAFVLHGPEPILVDTGPVIEAEGFMAALRSVIDPAELRWIWLTHPDFDHIGSLHTLLASNPELRVVTTFLGMGIMGLSSPLSPDRVRFVNPGETVRIGGRTLEAFKPPVFDNPATTAFRDVDSQVVWTSDCFGALLDSVPQDASELDEEALRAGQLFWATVDSPWLHVADPDALRRRLDMIRAMEPSLVLSSHLPPAPGHMADRLISAVAAAPGATPFVGPDQAALEAMLASMTGPG